MLGQDRRLAAARSRATIRHLADEINARSPRSSVARAPSVWCSHATMPTALSGRGALRAAHRPRQRPLSSFRSSDGRSASSLRAPWPSCSSGPNVVPILTRRRHLTSQARCSTPFARAQDRRSQDRPASGVADLCAVRVQLSVRLRRSARRRADRRSDRLCWCALRSSIYLGSSVYTGRSRRLEERVASRRCGGPP